MKVHDYTESLERIHEITLKPTFATLDSDLRVLAKDLATSSSDVLDSYTLLDAESKIVVFSNRWLI